MVRIQGDGVIEMGRNEFGALNEGFPGFADARADDEGFDGKLEENVGRHILR